MVMSTPNAPSRPQVALRIVRADGGTEAIIPMRTDSLLCGRQADVSIPEDPFVAPHQARFFYSGHRLAVEDVGGGNGLFVRLRAEKELTVGGELRIGRQRLLLEPVPALAPGANGLVAWGSPDKSHRFRLVQLLEGGLRGGAHLLRDGENQVGRELGDITFVADGFVSGRHATLTVSQDRVLVRDLNSSNGTFIKVTAPVFVENTDQFLIGRQLIRVDLQAA